MLEIHERAQLDELLATTRSLDDVVLSGLDLRPYRVALREVSLRGAVLLGCQLEPADLVDMVERGVLVFPRLPEGLPFEPWRTRLYAVDELFDVFDASDPCTYCDCVDARIYRHFREHGGAAEPPLLEALARRLHDHGVSEALEALLVEHPKVVAFMGGHGMLRGDASYVSVAHLAARLAERGYLVATGVARVPWRPPTSGLASRALPPRSTTRWTSCVPHPATATSAGWRRRSSCAPAMRSAFGT